MAFTFLGSIGADTVGYMSDMGSALHLAAARSNTALMQILLARGADINCKSHVLLAYNNTSFTRKASNDLSTFLLSDRKRHRCIGLRV